MQATIHLSTPKTLAAVPAAQGSVKAIVLLGVAASLAALGLHLYPICRPFLFDDDFALIVESWTWPAAREHLWQPWNEHAMPLGRLSTWALVQSARRQTALPRIMALQGPVAALIGMWLVYVFVRRELGHAFYGLVAMSLFGISLKYNEAVFWFAASFAVLALDTTLLALLAAQRWRQTGRARHLGLCLFWAALAPGWFAAGILAGPLCHLYLLSGKGERRKEQGERAQSKKVPRLSFAFGLWPFALLPLGGTAVFLALSLPHNIGRIHHAEHYGGQTALQAFNPAVGLELTGRTVVDNLVFAVNAFGATCPGLLVLAALGLLVLGGWWWWRQAERRGGQPRLLLLGAGLVLFSYWLVYSFRAGWPYEAMMCRWTRYNLLPFLGLVLFLCGGLPSRQGTLFRLDPSGALTTGQMQGLGLLMGLLFLLQFPLGVAGHLKQDRDPADQMASLEAIEEIDARCRVHQVAAEQAQQALGRLEIPYSGEPPRINGWQLLRGSDCPREMSIDETRRLLAPDNK